MTEPERTNDTLFDGALHCLQHRDGYRFSIDPILLAHFVRLGKNEKVLDLCAGCGVIGLILLYRFGMAIESLTAFELQEGLVRLARENISLNHFTQKMQVIEGDLCKIKTYFSPESFSSVVCNPPFYAIGSGRISGNKEAQIARHQIACTLSDVITATTMAVKNRGRMYMVYPAEGLGIILNILKKQKFAVKRMQFVFSYPDPVMNARLLLFEAVKNGGEGVDVLPPFYIYEEKNGNYSKEMQKLYVSNSIMSI